MIYSGGGGAELRLGKGFTLAEVLITLGIIGIVAALTMPALVANYREKVAVTRLKKLHSTLSQAYMTAIAEHGTPDGWGLIAYGDINGTNNLLEIITPYLKITEQYPVDEENTNAVAMLGDGSQIYFFSMHASCGNVRGPNALANICAMAGIDINGSKAPNTPGFDIFQFYMTKNGAVIPYGTSDETGFSFKEKCTYEGGYACTAWVIYNENMDYLHCDDLSWDGKKKCD